MPDLYRINKTTLEDIADAIRQKHEGIAETDPIAVTDMSEKILEIETGGTIQDPVEETVTPDSEDLVIEPDEGFDGISKVTVHIDETGWMEIPTATLTITENCSGRDVTNYAKVNVRLATYDTASVEITTR